VYYRQQRRADGDREQAIVRALAAEKEREKEKAAAAPSPR
jgi:hypothetical protein